MNKKKTQLEFNLETIDLQLLKVVVVRRVP